MNNVLKPTIPYIMRIIELINDMNANNIEDYLLYDTEDAIYNMFMTEDDEEVYDDIAMTLESLAIKMCYFSYEDLAYSGTNYLYNIDNIINGLKQLILDLEEVSNG